jgi:hypothetical protein
VRQRVCEGVHYLEFSSDAGMCWHLMRFQEFWENPRFRGKPFNREQYLSWFLAKNGEEFKDPWVGCAFPSSAVDAFRDLRMTPDAAEDKVLDRLPDSGKYFVIASGPDPSTFEHELAHAFYYLDRSYRKKADAAVMGLRKSTREFLFDQLSQLWYGPRRLMDESQAYLLDGVKEFSSLIRPDRMSRQQRADFEKASGVVRAVFEEKRRSAT